MDYIELHARSAFSFLEGASVPEELITACKALEMPAMALLDRDGVYGSPRFHLAAQEDWDQGAYRSGNNSSPKSNVQSPKSKVQIQKSKFQIPNSKTQDQRTKTKDQRSKSQTQIAGYVLACHSSSVIAPVIKIFAA